MKNNKSEWFHVLIDLAYYCSLLVAFIVILFGIIYILSPEQMFTSEDQPNGVAMTYWLTDTWDNQIMLDQYMQSTSQTIRSNKWTMVAAWYLLAIPGILVSLYVLKTFKSISDHYLKESASFHEKHLKALETSVKLLVIISLTSKLILKVFLLVLNGPSSFSTNSLVFLPGLLIAGILMLFAQVFKHGLYLQEEYDMTL